DQRADPRMIASDLLSQAEHDPSAQVLLVTTSETIASQVEEALPRLAEELPRGAIASASLGNARIIVAVDLEQAVAIANNYAPEHLSLAIEDADALVPLVSNAGAVFAGRLAAETFGDYLAGSSHVLPTDGAARSWSGISVYSFLKAITIQSLTPNAARAIARSAAVLARLEGLEAHALAADAREAVQ